MSHHHPIDEKGAISHVHGNGNGHLGTAQFTNANGSRASLDSHRYVANTEDSKMPDTMPNHSHEAAEAIARLTPEEYAAMEKRLLRKLDFKLIPWMTLLYLLSFIDRVNVGAAKLVGLTTELHLSSLQYSNASMIFFVSYVAFEVPSNLVLKKLRPSRWIPFTMICWAIFQTCMGLVTTYGQLLALRFCLGLFESGLFPGLNFYLTGWYKRDEINRRCAFFFGGAVLAGAFGGIFGYALSKMNGVGGKQGWAWIFIIEGLITLVAGVLSFWMIHDWPDTAKFLTPLEREMVLVRLKQEQGLASEGKFTWRVIKKALVDWKTYCFMLMYIGAAEPLYSLFTPTIIAYLGKFSIEQSLLLSTPPYVLMFITTMGTAFLSDKFHRRGFFLMGWSLVGAIGYLMLLTIPIRYPGALYFAVFVASAAVGPLIATTIAWTGNTFGNHYKKAVAMGLVFSAGNSGGIVSSQAYRDKDKPRFLPGHGTALAFCLLNCTMATIMYFGVRRENKRRDEMYGPPPRPDEVQEFEDPEYQRKWGLQGMTRAEIVELGDDHPAFRYIL
ncbi:hypothetical protein I317_04076 [Kwoniella heveanensis CBS 569]|uniref:Major facilitator superfamily (MFS) profile domain-containing protein n=1 Tax=Kwoniella heveanensis BCC8398 TaxID=1296120 RepID=A0A1B9H387_9TREE|nr:hypothetical protein I316_00847 [Kwoniella heveanensis BCC8398]OCF42105.1 hypothetical protein I317_04076 [Kwoniella heveanensis CBS 569]